jgi:hypothetical protein
MLHGDQRALLKELKELLLDEWSVGVYHRELALPVPVNARCANVTYGNGVLMVALPSRICVMGSLMVLSLSDNTLSSSPALSSTCIGRGIWLKERDS